MSWFFEALFNYAKFSGRCSRAQYWWFILFLVVGYLLFFAVDCESLTLVDIGSEIAGLGTDTSVYQVLEFQPVWLHLYFWLTLFPFLAINVRRLHDTDRSGWNVLLAFIPLGQFFLIYYQVQRGTEGDNRFGESIKDTPPVKATYKRVVKFLFISVVLLTLAFMVAAYTDVYTLGELSEVNGLDGFVKSLSLVIFIFCGLIASCFWIDWRKRSAIGIEENQKSQSEEDDFAGLGLDNDDYADGAEEDEFEELEPLSDASLGVNSLDNAAITDDLTEEFADPFDDADDDFEQLEIT